MSKDLFKQTSLQKLFDGLDRGGTRGGKDQFKWDDVKNDKDRAFYLGNTIMAPVGRANKNRDIMWYTKGEQGSQNPHAEKINNKEQAAIKYKEEMARIQQEERQQMLEKMGLAPKRASVPDELNSNDLKKALLRGDTSGPSGSRIQGLGFAPSAQHEINDELRIKMENEKLDALKNGQNNAFKLKGISAAANNAASAISNAANELKSALSEDELKLLLKQHKKEEKAAKKDRKKHKKEAKEAKRELKKAKKKDDSDDSLSDSRSRSRSPTADKHKKSSHRSYSPRRSRSRSTDKYKRRYSKSRSPRHN